MPIIGLALIVAALEFFDVIDLVPFLGGSIAVGLYCGLFGTLFWIGGVAYSSSGMQLEPEQFNPCKRFGAEVAWQDYYASKDPVPNGPLFDPDQEATFLKSKEVHNRASLWSDHTTYWLNRDQFVPYVLQDLSSFANLSLLDVRNGDTERLATAARRRQWRVRWLAGARLAMWITAGLIAITRMSDLPKWGATVLSELPVVENFFGWLWGKDLSGGKFGTDPWAQGSVGVAAVVRSNLCLWAFLARKGISDALFRGGCCCFAHGAVHYCRVHSPIERRTEAGRGRSCIRCNLLVYPFRWCLNSAGATGLEL